MFHRIEHNLIIIQQSASVGLHPGISVQYCFIFVIILCLPKHLWWWNM